ncbi:MAG: DNA repair protein RecO C-terminal domain-containing protein [Muribaculaceae bacterium]|nr:DNA repair protein RecO C-terminal domain-containing protein [Muribaculaceae bacterium]MDE6026510.1 DNA repair protein RecO C-terminal domain-containing protein [Muribaculaceae bacterium]
MAIERITGIVTDIVRHNDRNSIVSLFTRTRGRIAFLSPVGSGKTGRARNARLQPLSIVESDVNFKESKSLQTLGAVAYGVVWKDLYFNPVKSAIVMFLSEFLNRYLRDAAPEPLLWDYVARSLALLDERRGRCGNFHLSFLTGFLQFAGITPDIHDLETGEYFDMQAGRAVPERPRHNNVLSPAETSFLPRLLRMNFENDRCFRFKAGERRMILSRMLQYYSVHYPGMANLKSPDILAEVFS